MTVYSEYYIKFLGEFFANLWTFIKSIALSIAKFFGTDIGKYFSDLFKIFPELDLWGWLLLILVTLINLTFVVFLIYKIAQLLRRYVFTRSKEVEKDELIEEIARLKEQAEELVRDKNRIFALKVNADLNGGNEFANETSTDFNAPVSSKDSTATKSENGRFVKLADIDKKFDEKAHYVFMNQEDLLTLPELVDRFINFAASQLRLYYSPKIVRLFFAGMGTGKIIILEGISGTGKTSLPYAMAKFFDNNAGIVSVQPSWRDRADILGYFNEFTKKFNETDFLSNLYESTWRDDPNFIVLDEMNLARIEYYFADFLSIMEMPDTAEWKIDIVPSSLPTDPKNLVYGKVIVPQNLFFIGTANKDDSTFTITDKVYDRAIAIELNDRTPYFDAHLTENYPCSYDYLENLFNQAAKEHRISDTLMKALMELDVFIQSKFKTAFGNRILRQIRRFVPVYMGLGGTDIEALDFMVCSKILRKFVSLNLPFLTKELNELSTFLDKKFGAGKFKLCQDFIKELQRNI